MWRRERHLGAVGRRPAWRRNHDRGELRELLGTYPDDLRVVVNGYEQGYDDVSPGQISVVRLALDVGVEDWRDGTKNRIGSARTPTSPRRSPTRWFFAARPTDIPCQLLSLRHLMIGVTNDG